MDLGLKGRRALVCASTKGIGRAIANGLAAEGVDLFLCARDTSQVEAAVRDIASQHRVETFGMAVDLTHPDAADKLLRAVAADFGPVDILINNVGGPPPSTALNTTRDQWDAGYQRLFLTPVLLTQGLVGGMVSRNFGRILTVTSLVAVEPNPALCVSTAMRAAATAYFKTLSLEVAAQGVTVHTLMPGLIDTDRLRTLHGSSAAAKGGTLDEELSRMAQAIPMKRIGTAQEFAALAVFLCSPQAAYLQGLNVAVDGGSRRGLA